MKIRSLWLEHFKKFDQPVLIDGFTGGLNLLAGPNEMGKSTLFLALRAALFERHSSKAQAIKDLQPNHVEGAAPAVAVELEIDGDIYRIEKRFLRRPMARLERPDGRVAEGHDAEAAIRQLLHVNDEEKISLDQGSPGHFNVMLTPQTHSFQQPTLPVGTRQTLEEAIAAEIEQPGSQSEVDDILATVDASLFEIVDRRGKPKGRFKEIEARLVEIGDEIDRQTEARDALASDIQALSDAEARRHAFGSAGDDGDLDERLERLEAERASSIRRREIESRIQTARLRLERLTAKEEQRQKLADEKEALTRQHLALGEEEAALGERLAAALDSIAGQESSLQSLNEQRKTLTSRQQQLEKLGDRCGRLEQIDNALRAMATDVRFDLDQRALGRVRINQAPLENAGALVPVIEGLAIDIEDVGRIMIEPKTQPMQELLDNRKSLEAAIGELARTLDLDSIEAEAIEAVWQETSAAVADLDQGRSQLETTLSTEREALDEIRAALNGATARRQQTAERLEALERQLGEQDGDGDRAGATPDPETDIAAATAVLQTALAEAGGGTTAPIAGDIVGKSLDQLEADIKNLRARQDMRRQQLEDARVTIERLRATVAVRAGLGLDERLEELHRRQDVLSKERAAYRLDQEALTLLKSTLLAAANDVRATFHAPLAARLRPYIQALLPDASPTVTTAFGISALGRGGAVDEDFEQLSDGTREQIAILARLAFASMLKEQGLPSLVVLDDALVFSDDDRLLRVFRILERAAGDLQIIILTCREDRFARLDAKHLHIEHLAPSRSAGQVVEA